MNDIDIEDEHDMSSQKQDACDVIKQLINAMTHATEVGCVDHLDCTPDYGKFWYKAINNANKFLNISKTKD